MRIGVFFGGPSREREISFAGGRTVCDNLDRDLFEPVPVFVDSLGNFILLRWQFLYQGSIRDFYPPVLEGERATPSVYIEALEGRSPSEMDALMAQAGERIQPEQFSKHFDFVFLALHGPQGEDGTIQGLLEWYKMPYSGSGVLGTALGIDKVAQKRCMKEAGLYVPPYFVVQRSTWLACANPMPLLQQIVQSVGLPFVVKSARQGSSIGVSIVKHMDGAALIQAMERCFFLQSVTAEAWRVIGNTTQWKVWIDALLDLRQGIGLPVWVLQEVIADPDRLFERLQTHFAHSTETVRMQSIYREEQVLCEAFVEGKEFSCVVLEPQEGVLAALPPTEMLKKQEVLDYRAKYLPGVIAKRTPIDLPTTQVASIQQACKSLFQAMHFQVYARIDGFVTPAGEVVLNDPNTTAGMNPSSFLFHQAAEIGFSPKQLLTFLIRRSLAAQAASHRSTPLIVETLKRLDHRRTGLQQRPSSKTRVGVMMGGFSQERHISLESGRNVYQKLAASESYAPLPIFLSGTPERPRFFVIPLHILLKDHADDIHAYLVQLQGRSAEGLDQTRGHQSVSALKDFIDQSHRSAWEILPETFLEHFDFAFMALHGRPGEDGTLQRLLEGCGIPYNGSGPQTSALCIDKYETNQHLSAHGVHTADQMLLRKDAWRHDPDRLCIALETQLSYPLVVKPVDEGCSASVCKIENRRMLSAYLSAAFEGKLDRTAAAQLGVEASTSWPCKSVVLAEAWVAQGDAETIAKRRPDEANTGPATRAQRIR